MERKRKADEVAAPAKKIKYTDPLEDMAIDFLSSVFWEFDRDDCRKYFMETGALDLALRLLEDRRKVFIDNEADDIIKLESICYEDIGHNVCGQIYRLNDKNLTKSIIQLAHANLINFPKIQSRNPYQRF